MGPLGAYCVSGPDAGSDGSSLRTRAVHDEAKDEWVINGTKAWITNGGIADVHVVVATVDPELRGRGQASFVVPPGTPGVSQGQKYKKRSEEHTSELQSLMRISYAVFCLKKKNKTQNKHTTKNN